MESRCIYLESILVGATLLSILLNRNKTRTGDKEALSWSGYAFLSSNISLILSKKPLRFW